MQVIHARSGGVYEIMGLMQGRVQGDTLVILDSFALPVQGTETRVSAGNEALEYMAQYIESSEKVRVHLLTGYMMLRLEGLTRLTWCYRLDEKRTSSGGITHILATDAGFLVSTSRLNRRIRGTRIHLWPSW